MSNALKTIEDAYKSREVFVNEDTETHMARTIAKEMPQEVMEKDGLFDLCEEQLIEHVRKNIEDYVEKTHTRTGSRGQNQATTSSEASAVGKEGSASKETLAAGVVEVSTQERRK